MTQTSIELQDSLDESVRFISSRTSLRPATAIVLGSGLGEFGETLNERITISTTEIPNYPRSTVEGHQGNVIFGTIGKIPLLVFQGRVHYYETGKLETILYPIMLASGLGIKTLLVTNAAGGINKKFRPGDLMLITDQLNLTFEPPAFRGRYAAPGGILYDLKLRKSILRAAKSKKIRLHQGVYCGVQGPSYETAAEIRMIQTIGGDVVGMSTVNEVSFAVSLGLKVAGISCVTNLSTGISDARLSHSEVTIVAERGRKRFERLMIESIHAFHRS